MSVVPVELASNFWVAVARCLEKFHDFKDGRADEEVTRLRRRLKKSPGLANEEYDLIYHAEPWTIACNLAGLAQELPLEKYRSDYESLLREIEESSAFRLRSIFSPHPSGVARETTTALAPTARALVVADLERGADWTGRLVLASGILCLCGLTVRTYFSQDRGWDVPVVVAFLALFFQWLLKKLRVKNEETGKAVVAVNETQSFRFPHAESPNNQQTQVIVYTIFFATAVIAATIYLTRQ